MSASHSCLSDALGRRCWYSHERGSQPPVGQEAGGPQGPLPGHQDSSFPYPPSWRGEGSRAGLTRREPELDPRKSAGQGPRRLHTHLLVLQLLSALLRRPPRCALLPWEGLGPPGSAGPPPLRQHSFSRAWLPPGRRMLGGPVTGLGQLLGLRWPARAWMLKPRPAHQQAEREYNGQSRDPERERSLTSILQRGAEKPAVGRDTPEGRAQGARGLAAPSHPCVHTLRTLGLSWVCGAE